LGKDPKTLQNQGGKVPRLAKARGKAKKKKTGKKKLLRRCGFFCVCRKIPAAREMNSEGTVPSRAFSCPKEHEEKPRKPLNRERVIID